MNRIIYSTGYFCKYLGGGILMENAWIYLMDETLFGYFIF